MKRNPIRHVLLTTAATVSGVVLLLTLKSNAPFLPPVGAVGSAQSQQPPASAPAAGDSGPAAPPPGEGEAPEAQGGADRTVRGETVQTDYGPVQVEIALSGGRVTKASAVRAPSSSPRSKEITSTAVPRLNRQAVDAQNADVDTVSGATFTSEGYADSLQSALDQAGG